MMKYCVRPSVFVVPRPQPPEWLSGIGIYRSNHFLSPLYQNNCGALGESIYQRSTLAGRRWWISREVGAGVQLVDHLDNHFDLEDGDDIRSKALDDAGSNLPGGF